MRKYTKKVNYIVPLLLIVVTVLFHSVCGLKQSSEIKNKIIKKIPFEVNQAVAVDKKYYYAISNIKIVKCDKKTNKVIATWEADTTEKKYKHFHHLNSGTVIDGKLYCAHSRYDIDPNDNTVEIWNVEGKLLEHEQTIHMPRKYGSLTWIDQHPDGTWWMCYAVYGEGENHKTKLVKYQYLNNKFVEVENWGFPKEVVNNWEDMSCSGGSWGPDGLLYTTGHDYPRAYVLRIDDTNNLSLVRIEKEVGFFGQGIAWDRYSKKPILWGIERNKNITQTYIPQK